MENSNLYSSVEMWDRLTKAYEGIKKSFIKQISAFDLTAPQFGVLKVLFENGSLPLKKISEKLSVTGANITCVVDNLEKDNLVERVHSKRDRRIILAELTEDGKNKYLEILPKYESSILKLTQNLSEDEKKDLSHLLNKLNKNGRSTHS